MAFIVQHADGSITQHEQRPGTAGIATGRRWAETPRILDQLLEGWDWSAKKVAPILDAWRKKLCAEVDAQREAHRSPYMTQLLGQSFIYASKGREADTYRSLATNVLIALTAPQRRLRFPIAMAEADITGDSLATVIARYQAGQDASNAALGRIEARATQAKAAIRAATTLETMKAAAAVDWS